MRVAFAALSLLACTGAPAAPPGTGSGEPGGGGAGGVVTTSVGGGGAGDGGAGGVGGVGGAGGGAPFTCPQDGVRGKGRHRLFVQGHEGEPLPSGAYPLLHEWQPGGGDALLCDDAVFVDDTNKDGVWQPGEEPHPLGPSAIVHGEHFLVGPGAYAEFEAVLCDDITGDVVLYIPNFDVSGSKALHQLFVVHDGKETLVAEAVDDEAGQNGYNPFIRVLSGVDPQALPGDILRLRSTNLNGYQFSVMVWNPPSEYESWVVVEVP